MAAVVFLALIAHVSYALNDMSGALGSRKFGGNLMSLMSWLVGIVMYIVMLPFLGGSPLYLWPSVVALLTGVILAIAYPIFLWALKHGNATLVGVVAATFPLWTVIASLFLYNETLTQTQALLIGVIMTGVILSSLHISRKTRLRNLFNRYTLVAFGVSIMWGIGFSLFKYPVDNIGWFNAGFLDSIAGTALSVAWLYPKLKGKVKPAFKKYYLYPTANAITGVVGTLAFSLALTKGNSSLVAPIAGSYGAFFAVLSYLVFKEKLNKLQIVGVIVTLIGIVSLSIALS